MADMTDVQVVRITDVFGLEIEQEKWGINLPLSSFKDIVGIQPSLLTENVIVHCKNKIIEVIPL